jgi:hypothetical protein
MPPPWSPILPADTKGDHTCRTFVEQLGRAVASQPDLIVDALVEDGDGE